MLKTGTKLTCNDLNYYDDLGHAIECLIEDPDCTDDFDLSAFSKCQPKLSLWC